MTQEESNSPIIKRTPNGSNKEQLIKVCVRLKPVLNDQCFRDDVNDYIDNDDDDNYQNQRSSYGNYWQISEGKHLHNLKTKDQFSFDRVYTPNMSTQEIFSRDIRELVNSSMDGFNATVFAYGQTSSGKTYTMRGNDKSPGLIPYSIFELFKIAGESHPAKQFEVEISYVEIYNEQLKDLLPKNCEQSFEEVQKSNSNARRKSISVAAATTPNRGLDIRESVKNGIFIKGLCKHRVTSIEETLDKLQQGDRNRTFAQTKLNTRSSRSHTIFRVHIKSYENPEEEQNASNDNSFNTSILRKSKYKQSILSLVDLAGSQGVNKTHTEGLRFRECSNINKSLLALSNVIHKLSQKSAAAADNGVGSISSSNNNLSNVFINFRDSKLTRILQPSLQGHSKTCIICLISQDTKNYQQTLNTLKFGFKAMSIKPFVRINQMNIFTDHNLYSHAISNGKLREALLEIQGLRHAMGVKDQKIEKLTNTTKKQEKELFLQQQQQQQQNQRMAFMNRQDDTDEQNISTSNAGALLFPDDSVSNNSITEEQAVLGRISRIPPLNTGNALMFQNSMNSSRSSRVKDEKNKRAMFHHKRQTSQDISSPSSKSNRYRTDPNSRFMTQNSLPPQHLHHQYQSQWSGIPTPSKQQIISPFNLSQKDVGDDISPNYFGIEYQTQQLRGRVQQLEKQISKKEEDLRHALQISSYLQSEIESTFQANKILQGENEDLRQEQTQIMEIIQNAEKNKSLVKSLTKQNSELKSKLGLLKREQMEDTRRSGGDLKQLEIIDLSCDESQKNRLEDEIKQLQDKLQKQSISYDQLKQHTSQLQQLKNEVQSNLHAVQKNFEMLKNEYSSVNNQLELSKAQNDRAQKSIKFFMNENVQLKNDLNFYKKEIKIVSNATGSNGGEYLAEEKRKMQDSYQGKVKALKNERNQLKDMIQKLNLELSETKQMHQNSNRPSISVQIQTLATVEAGLQAQQQQEQQMMEGIRMDVQLPASQTEQQFDERDSEQIKQQSVDSLAPPDTNQLDDQQQKLLRPRSNTKIPPLLACYPILVHKRKGNSTSWDKVLDQRSKSLKIQAHHSLQMANKLRGIFIQLLENSGGMNKFSKLSQSYQTNFQMINSLMSDVILDSDTIRYIIQNQLPPPSTTPFDVTQTLLTQQANSEVNNAASIVTGGGGVCTGKRASLRSKKKKKKSTSPLSQFQSPRNNQKLNDSFSNDKLMLQQQQQQSYSSTRRSKRLLGQNPECQISQFS